MNRHYCEWCLSYSRDDARGNCSACGGWRTEPAKKKPAERDWSTSGSSWSSGSAAVMTWPVDSLGFPVRSGMITGVLVFEDPLAEDVAKQMGRRFMEYEERAILSGSLLGGV